MHGFIDSALVSPIKAPETDVPQNPPPPPNPNPKHPNPIPIPNPSKSIGALTTQLLSILRSSPTHTIDTIATTALLQIKRRRLFDIINPLVATNH
jgi:hypothetical protein